MILDFTFPTTPANSPLHRGRTRYIATLKHLLASVSPPVQGGAGGGSPFILNFKFYITQNHKLHSNF